jgi:hypothetical protein
MNKIQQDVEQYIRHLQSSLDTRKRVIGFALSEQESFKGWAKIYYEQGETVDYQHHAQCVREYKTWLKQLHKEQATETRMLKFFENARSFAIALENTK